MFRRNPVALRFGGMLLAVLAAVCRSAPAGAPVFIDIHLPVRGAAYSLALASNKFLNAALDNKEIDFETKHTPHVTLYLTSWTCSRGVSYSDGETCVQRVEDAVESTIYDMYVPGKRSPCRVKVGEPFAAGTYAMLNVTLDDCLQRYSDLIVNSTYRLSAPNQTVPSWVRNLPEPERDEKIHDIEEYGSPNVFSQFQPHVSVGWSSNASAVADAVESLKRHMNVHTASFLGEVVALGSVSAHGTVLQHADLGIFNITDRDPCSNHVTYADCKKDNVTFGGCVWCDVVDHPAWCTTRMRAADLPRFPPHQCT